MGQIVIRSEGLGKQYGIGSRAPYQRLSEVPYRWATGIWHRLTERSGKGQQAEQERRASDFWALRDVSFEIREGDAVGIIGRNGAGKSTLLKILSRITPPTEGRFGLRGRVGCLLEVGTGFHPELTGRENIYLNGAILGMTRREIQRRFDQIVAFSEVERFLDTAVKHYSSGMYLRLAFAVAAHLEPEILILDEVLSVGDLVFQKKCLDKMHALVADGRTVILVSHNLPSVANLCQRALLLHAGQILAEGTAIEVIQKYVALARAAGGEALWPDPAEAPGTDVVRLHAVRILQEGHHGSTADVAISKEVVVEICYWNLQPGASLYCGLWLKDQHGTPVLSTFSAKATSLTPDAWDAKPRPAGLFRSVCRLPANFLNEGRYSVTAIVGRGASDTQVLKEDVVSFNVHDTGEMRGAYLGPWLGVIRPRLPWNSEYLGELDQH